MVTYSLRVSLRASLVEYLTQAQQATGHPHTLDTPMQLTNPSETFYLISFRPQSYIVKTNQVDMIENDATDYDNQLYLQIYFLETNPEILNVIRTSYRYPIMQNDLATSPYFKCLKRVSYTSQGNMPTDNLPLLRKSTLAVQFLSRKYHNVHLPHRFQRNMLKHLIKKFTYSRHAYICNNISIFIQRLVSARNGYTHYVSTSNTK